MSNSNATPQCGCNESYPQLNPGCLSHGPDCPNHPGEVERTPRSKSNLQILADAGLNPFAYLLVIESVTRHGAMLGYVELVFEPHRGYPPGHQVRITVAVEPLGTEPTRPVVQTVDDRRIASGPSLALRRAEDPLRAEVETLRARVAELEEVGSNVDFERTEER